MSDSADAKPAPGISQWANYGKNELTVLRRRRVAELRFIEDNLSPREIVDRLANEDPPIVVTTRTIERDIAEIRDNSREYLNIKNFDARAEVATMLARFDMLARGATRQAMDTKNKSAPTWARRAIEATVAKATLLQDIGLLDRKIGTVFFGKSEDAGKPERIPDARTLLEYFREAKIIDAEMVPEAERAWLYGDQAALPAKADTDEGDQTGTDATTPHGTNAGSS